MARILSPLSRRRFATRALAGAALGAPFVISARAAETLVVNGYGAEYQDLLMKTTIEPFEKKFGVKVTYDNTGSASENYAKIRAGRGTSGFDVAGELTPPEVILGAREKLLEPLTEREIPNLKHVWKKSAELIPNTGVVHTYQYLALLWNTKRLDKPDSWADYWRPGQKYGDKVKGHVINFDPANLLSVYALIMAAKLNGGGVDNLEPAWDVLKAQKPYVGTVVVSSAQAAPYFENEQVWIAPYWSPRSGYYKAQGYPVDFLVPKEGTIGLANCGAVPIGAANKKLAYEFLNFRLEPHVQRAFHVGYFSSPARGDITGWPADYAAQQITTEAKMAAVDFPDSETIARKRREWTVKWKEIMGA